VEKTLGGRALVRQAGPEHAHQRKASAGALCPKVVKQQWADMLKQVADELLEHLTPQGEGDLISAFAGPFSALTLGYAMGFEHPSAEVLQEWSRVQSDYLCGYHVCLPAKSSSGRYPLWQDARWFAAGQ
jgi:cytochrome P450